MKKNTVIAALLLAASTTTSYAQSWSHFYNEEYGQRTVEPITGIGEYVMTETSYDPTGAQDHGIHFVRYDQAGNIVVPIDVRFDARQVEEYNVDLTNIGNKFLITSYYSPVGSGRVFVSNMLVDAAGNIAIPSVLMQSIDPNYPNLYAMDAVYDPGFNQFVICGMASNGDFLQSTSKAAFVATVDPNTLMTTNMMFYESNSGSATTDDFDIANRVVLNSTGRYYVTGSENVMKAGNTFMGIRNMLIDPASLFPIWSNPISFNNTYSNENSVDMAEANSAGGLQFFTLVNGDAANKWYMLRIDPGTGAFLNPFIETVFSYRGYGHSIRQGNAPNEVVVSGMKYRAQGGGCYSGQDQEATPFMATIDITNPLGFFTSHVEYNTVISNSPYWTIGNAYQPSPGFYPNPIYLNNFADRENAGFPYSVATPIKGASGPINTKFLDVNPGTGNGCDDIVCSYGLDFNDYSTYPGPALWNYNAPWNNPQGGIRPRATKPFASRDCASGYYRGEEATAVANVKEGSLAIYPNPATDKISVALGSNYNNAEIALYDMAGKKIAALHSGEAKGTLQLELPTNMATGIYMLQVNGDGNKTITERITVNK